MNNDLSSFEVTLPFWFYGPMVHDEFESVNAKEEKTIREFMAVNGVHVDYSPDCVDPDNSFFTWHSSLNDGLGGTCLTFTMTPIKKQN